MFWIEAQVLVSGNINGILNLIESNINLWHDFINVNPRYKHDGRNETTNNDLNTIITWSSNQVWEIWPNMACSINLDILVSTIFLTTQSVRYKYINGVPRWVHKPHEEGMRPSPADNTINNVPSKAGKVIYVLFTVCFDNHDKRPLCPKHMHITWRSESTL